VNSPDEKTKSPFKKVEYWILGIVAIVGAASLLVKGVGELKNSFCELTSLCSTSTKLAKFTGPEASKIANSVYAYTKAVELDGKVHLSVVVSNGSRNEILIGAIAECVTQEGKVLFDQKVMINVGRSLGSATKERTQDIVVDCREPNIIRLKLSNET